MLRSVSKNPGLEGAAFRIWNGLDLQRSSCVEVKLEAAFFIDTIPQGCRYITTCDIPRRRCAPEYYSNY